MPDTRTVTVSIGKNGTNSETSWQQFKLDTLYAVRSLADAVYFQGEGIGIWEGVSETAFTVVAGIPQTSIPTLLGAARNTARRYGQDAIAVTVGDTTLAGKE